MAVLSYQLSLVWGEIIAVSILDEWETILSMCLLWQYGLWSFLMGDTKLERFLPKNQHTHTKLFNLEFWINGELSKSAKI